MILDIQTYFEVTLVQFGTHEGKQKGKEKWLSIFHTVALLRQAKRKG